MHYEPSTIFVTGRGKPAKDDVITNVYQVFTLSLIVDTKTDIIVDANVNSVMEMTSDFIRGILTEYNLITEICDIENEIKCRFFGLVQKALIVALKDAYNKYQMICTQVKL
ncbi:MAG: DUF3870 domain-containing protein [Marinisporobacter sp.]|jgi:hypothetical protein|nr:DUF3870 domain-containing protein [Marinisporobacter sp.]